MQQREILRQYLFAILRSEDAAKGKTPTEVGRNVAKVFGRDLAALSSEAAQGLLSAKGNTIASAAIGKLSEVVNDMFSRGIGVVWKDLQRQYASGVDVKARRRAQR